MKRNVTMPLYYISVSLLGSTTTDALRTFARPPWAALSGRPSTAVDEPFRWEMVGLAPHLRGVGDVVAEVQPLQRMSPRHLDGVQDCIRSRTASRLHVHGIEERVHAGDGIRETIDDRHRDDRFAERILEQRGVAPGGGEEIAVLLRGRIVQPSLRMTDRRVSPIQSPVPLRRRCAERARIQQTSKDSPGRPRRPGGKRRRQCATLN